MSDGKAWENVVSDYDLAVNAADQLRLAIEASLRRDDLAGAVVMTGLLRAAYSDILGFLERGAAAELEGAYGNA